MKKLFTIFLILSNFYFSIAQIVITEIMYNPPESGTDYLEYIEFFNISNSPVNMQGYSIKEAVVMNFPDTTIPAFGSILICVDSIRLDSILGVKALQWEGGALRNTDELITLLDENKNFVDSVHYYSTWDNLTNGNGASLELCRPSADNARNEYWNASDWDTGLQLNGKIIFASPGLLNAGSCSDQEVLVSDFRFTPSDIEIYVGEKVEWRNQGGHHNVNGNQSVFPSNPVSFGNGAPSTANWSYIQRFDVPGVYEYQCDVHAGQGMKGTVTVINRDYSYPVASIGLVTSINGDGVLDSFGKRCTLEGVVYGGNLRPTGLQFTMIDGLDDGIAVFLSSGNLGYIVAEGDLIRVKGQITQFNGLAEIVPDSLFKLSSGNSLVNATGVSSLNENTESQLIEMKNMELVDPNEWTNNSLGFTVKITDGTNIREMRIDNDVNIHGTSAPVGKFNVKGLGTQFDASLPYLEGYQIVPRYLPDITLISSTKNEIATTITIYPNPVSHELRIQTSEDFEKITLMDIQGRQIISTDFHNSIYLDIAPGLYYLKITGQKEHVLKFIKL
jgi:plastocyanin